MYSKAETQRLKHEFWIAFAEQYPRKWLLYDTKIKDFAFRFFADNKVAQVAIEIGMKDDEKRYRYFEKLESFKTILEEDFIPGLVFERDEVLESGKVISRVWIEKRGLSMNNRAHWDEIFEFFAEKMTMFEAFYYEYEDIIKS